MGASCLLRPMSRRNFGRNMLASWWLNCGITSHATPVSEMRVHIGPGYRVYFSRRAEVVYLLLVGGDKSSQKRDIKRAIEMARSLDKE